MGEKDPLAREALGGRSGDRTREDTSSDDRPVFLSPQMDYLECYICGEHMEDLSWVEGLDVSGPDEYYPEMKPVCPTHGNDTSPSPHINTPEDERPLDVYLNDERLRYADGGPQHWLFETDVDGDGAYYEVTLNIQTGIGAGAQRWQSYDRSDTDGYLVSFEAVPTEDDAVRHRFEGVETDDVLEVREVER